MNMNRKAPQSVILPSDLLLDPTKEPLKIILAPYNGITHVPSELAAGNGPDLMVFIELNKCFKRQGNVAEGMLGNVMWGFEQCGFDPAHVAAGLTALRKSGFIRYTYANGETCHDYDYDVKKPIWIRYEPKFTDLFVRSLIIRL